MCRLKVQATTASEKWLGSVQKPKATSEERSVEGWGLGGEPQPFPV